MEIKTRTFERLHHTFCYKILPLVYDNSLSYYELLCRVQHTVNEIIDYLDELGPGLDNVLKEFEELKEYVDNYFDNLDVQEEINNKIDDMIEDGTFVELLQQIALGYITPEMYGTEGDGTTDDSEHFTEAVAVSLTTGKPLHLHNNKYNLSTIQNIEMCSLYGEGAEMYTGTHAFTYGDNITLSGVNFYNDDRYLKTENPLSLFYSGTERKRVIIENCTYTCRLADDTHRGRIFFRVFAEELTVENVTLYGAYRCFVVSNSTQLESKKYSFNNVTAYNTETCIDIEGYQNSNTFEGYIKNVHISNITMINTENEQINAEAEPGRDCIIIGNVDGFTIDNVYCERAFERAVYCSICQYGSISNVNAKNCEGVKIGGAQINSLNIKKSFHISVDNVNIVDGINKRAMIIYNSRNIHVNGLSFYNANGYGSHGIELTGVLDEIFLRNITIDNCLRSVIVIYETQNWVNYITNLHIDGVKAINPVNGVTDYYAIRVDGTDSVFVRNLSIKNVMINDGQELYDPDSFLDGAVKLAYTSHAVLENIKAWGCRNLNKPQLDIQSSCSYIYVYGEYLLFSDKYPDIASSNGNYTMVAMRARNIESARFECLGNFSSVPVFPTHVIQKIGGTLQTGIAMQLINIRNGRVEIYTTIGRMIVDWVNGAYTATEQCGSVNFQGNVSYDPLNHTITSVSGDVGIIVIVNRIS